MVALTSFRRLYRLAKATAEPHGCEASVAEPAQNF